MTTFNWKILSISEGCKKVHYLLTATDEIHTVESEGNHVFAEETVNLPFNEIKESNLIDWLEKDTTQDDVNAIKLNLQNQLKAMENEKIVQFPWLADTFTPQV